VVQKFNIVTEDIWNMDETGLALGLCANGYVVSGQGRPESMLRHHGTANKSRFYYIERHRLSSEDSLHPMLPETRAEGLSECNLRIS
jgi:hypothetical protein